MSKREPSLHFHTLCHTSGGVRYCAQVQHDPSENLYRFAALYDSAHQRYLPIHQIESEYFRRIGSLSRFAIHSKWAARRRLKQYLKLWEDYPVERGMAGAKRH